jgi:hypothetical protein
MGWVVKQWRPEGVAALLGEPAREAAREVLEAAEREARRWGRMARRERAVADDELQRLEELGEELLQRVRRHHQELRAPAPAAAEAPDIVVRDLRRPGRPGPRARLRDSPLAGLFAASGRRSTT